MKLARGSARTLAIAAACALTLTACGGADSPGGGMTRTL